MMRAISSVWLDFVYSVWPMVPVPFVPVVDEYVKYSDVHDYVYDGD